MRLPIIIRDFRDLASPVASAPHELGALTQPRSPWRCREIAYYFLSLLFILLLVGPIRAAEPAPITITVDASEVNQQRIDARLVIPAKPGPMTLLYPKWLPGTHGPGGPIGRLGGMKLSAAGKPVAWQRDPLEMFAFHCEVPSGATALEFKPVSLSRLIDCPVIAGEHFRTIPLTGDPTPHQIDLACEDAKTLDLTPEFIEHMKQLVNESGAFFGARHYTNFHFLLGLSDKLPAFGLEHHECSVNTASPRALSGDASAKWWLTFLLPHEYLHSWNGKYRRPVGLVSPDYQGPQQTDLLWVYEGLTQYLGLVLDARSGLWTPEQYRENLALTAAELDRRSGRTWRPLADTALASQIHTVGSRHTWRGGSDYYYEGVFLWLEADGIIRKQSNGKRSLEDFCKAFFGGEDGKVAVKPYSFEDVINSLEHIAPHDWRGFFTKRLTSTDAHAPLASIEASGWRLVYTDALPEMLKSRC